MLKTQLLAATAAAAIFVGAAAPVLADMSIEYNATFAMEFESKAAFDAYTNSAAHKAWEKIYLPLREESHTQDITN